ncbi:hypothetical protein AB205_0212040 [Aquarana catesbeiana]|uniref:Uncharacterized protein n=1 Tax=Aquarana catesbeiana TaxID=8400 RepID=A0A2G9SFS8_AQUCT|nr:hypothetical protein AB205_0212040 [Aquarana catesbeiana]
MAETQQVRANYSNEEEEEESPELETSRSRRRQFKASNMYFGEMLEMVDILKRADYDGKYGPYPNPNVRKAKIIYNNSGEPAPEFRGTTIERSAQETVVGPKIKRTRAVQKDPESAAKK